MLVNISLYSAVSAVAQILIMGLVGYLLVKGRLLDRDGLNMITRLLIKFFLPVFMFYQLTTHFDFASFPHWWVFPLFGMAISLVAFIVGKIILFFYRRIVYPREFLSLIIFQNSGYIPLMLVTTLFKGEEAKTLYVYIFLLLIGFNLMMWSVGVWLLAKKRERGLDIKRIANPPLVVMFLTLFLISMGWQKLIPSVILRSAEMFSHCALPLAILVIGGGLAQIQLARVSLPSLLPVIATKLIILPFIALTIIWIWKIRSLFGFLLMIETVVPSAVTLAIIARFYQSEEEFVNQTIFYTHIISLITMPLFLTVYATVLRGMG